MNLIYKFIERYIYWSWIWRIPWLKYLYEIYTRLYNKRNSKKFIKVKLFNGSFMFMNDILHTQELQLKKKGIFENILTYKIIDTIKSRNISQFIDIWSNIWYYSVVVWTYFKDINIVSIEPEKNNFSILTRNINLNNIKNIKLYNMGLWSENKKEFIYYYPEVPWCTSIVNKDNHKNVIKKEIEIKKFDDMDWIKKDNILIKIDVEGYENEVFKWMNNFLKESKNIYLICELLEKTNSKKNIFNLLEKKWFRKIWSDNLDNYCFYKW